MSENTLRDRVERFVGELYGMPYHMPVPIADESLEMALEALVVDVSDGRFSLLAPKTLHNSDVSGAKTNVPDIKTFGNGDAWQLICKASSDREGWMKSTKAMQVGDAGCLVQVTTQQRNPDGSNAIAEAVTFVPKVHVADEYVMTNGQVLPDDPSVISTFSQDLNTERMDALAIMKPGSTKVIGRKLQPNGPTRL